MHNLNLTMGEHQTNPHWGTFYKITRSKSQGPGKSEED